MAHNYNKIAVRIPQTEICVKSCRCSHSITINPMRRRYWSDLEDEALRHLLPSTENINWGLVAKRLCQMVAGSARNSKQCRERWLNNIRRPGEEDSLWTVEEDRLILSQFINHYGMQKNKWVAVAKKINAGCKQAPVSTERTPNQIKNRFYSTFRKGIRRINAELGRPADVEEIRLLKPATVARLFQALGQSESSVYLQKVYSIALAPQNSNFRQKQSESQLLFSILQTVLSINRAQQPQKLQLEMTRERKLPNRKRSFETSPSDRDLFSLSQDLSGQPQPGSQSPFQEQEHYLNAIIGPYVDQQESLQFEQINFGV